nr:unnamed protein product [Amyelois transitella]
MSVKRNVPKSKFVAKLVTEEKGPCVFCQRDVDDELTYGKLYAIGSIKCHYFCVLLSCCMVQKGRDKDGLFGFLYPDILAEIERSKKHKCSYCNKEGATLGCCISQCRKQFHLPCGREKNAVSLFYGSYKSFCQQHTPKQKIADDVMAKARVRMQADRRKMRLMKEGQLLPENMDESSEPESVCVICYEPVEGYPTIQTFWPPCCARDAWFHRTCLQRMALSAGMHYLKCPLCNDKDNFYDAVVSQGYYVPDRDAAWELEQNAFAEIYDRPLHCDVGDCQCPMGRGHDSDSGMWDIKLCLLCGSSGAHAHCLSLLGESRMVCALCKAANTDVERLADEIEAVIATEQAQISRTERRPVMPSRMSLRRTKQRIANSASCSRYQETTSTNENKALETASSRDDLNLKPPKRPQTIRIHNSKDIQYIVSPTKIDRTRVLQDIKNKFASPTKIIEHLYEKVSIYNVDTRLVDEAREIFRKPKPLCVKRKIVDNVLDNILNSIANEKTKNKDPVKEWCSPKKFLENADVTAEETVKMISRKGNSPHKAPGSSGKFASRPSPLKIAMSPKKTACCPENTPKSIPLNIIIADKSKDISHNTNLNKSPNKEMLENEIKEENASDDESSNSTFQLPPEFIADDSNDSLPIFETPKLKTVDIQKDSSLEISENDEVVNVSVVKMEETASSTDFMKNLDLKSPMKSKKCAFKFSPLDNETLEKENVGFDLECFKNRYLNEVGRDFKCKFRHDHAVTEKCSKLRTAIDFAMEASRDRKRSLAEDRSLEEIPEKKRKITDGTEKQKEIKRGKSKRKSKKKKIKGNTTDIKLSNGKDNLKLSVQGKRKKKTRVSIKDKEIKVKIQWKKEKVQVKITESEVKQDCPKLKQYVLTYKDMNEPVLEKPQFDVTPMRRKYVKQEKSPDNFKQTSIQNFFKVSLPMKE